jgi:two-component system OmpR family response regulator
LWPDDINVQENISPSPLNGSYNMKVNLKRHGNFLAKCSHSVEPIKASPMTRILTIEDDAVTAREIVAELSSHGLDVDWVDNGREGLDRAVSGNYDLITLDRMLPELDGLAIVTTLRTMGVATPILMISALSDVDERVRGLRAGGDDYLTKPFATDEMAARVEVLLRRQNSGATQATTLQVADLQLDLISHEARRAEQVLTLLPTEYKLLEFLMRNSGQILSRMMIFEEVWGYHFDPGTNLIDVHIGRLRKKIDAAGNVPLIRTVRGSGYVIAEPV